MNGRQERQRSGSGATYAQAVTSIAINGERGTGHFSGYNETEDSCWENGSRTVYSFNDPFSLFDPTPIVTGISPSQWTAGQTAFGVIFTGQYFGTNAPTLTFSPSSGITSSITSYNDTQIVANITVDSSTPGESVSVTVTNNGYGGLGFQSGGGTVPTSSPATASVTAAPRPHHLKVISDTYAASTSCPTIRRRLVEYQEVDVNNNPVGTMQSKEQFSSKGTNSCGTTINTSESCSTDIGGTFTDQLTVGCSAVGHTPCGVTYTHQQWLWCPGTGSAVVIATPGDLVVTDNSISIGGNTAGFSAGQYIYP